MRVWATLVTLPKEKWGKSNQYFSFCKKALTIFNEIMAY
jgi:hypothetical protein